MQLYQWAGRDTQILANRRPQQLTQGWKTTAGVTLVIAVGMSLALLSAVMTVGTSAMRHM